MVSMRREISSLASVASLIVVENAAALGVPMISPG